MKYRFIRYHKHEFPVEKMCQTLQVSRGGYYAWLDRPHSKQEKENKKLLERIKAIHKESHKIYGSPRITDSLHDEGYTVSRPRVARLMRKNNIRAKTHRKFKAPAESFFGTLKKELVYHYNYKTRWEARQSIFEYIEIFYNRLRKHSSLGNLSPEQFLKLRKAA